MREPYDLKREEIHMTSSVNPSAWVFDRYWLEKNIVLLRPHIIGDGYPPEFWLPDLVSLAYDQGEIINEVPLSEFWQAMGVNTTQELEEVRVRWRHAIGSA